MLSTQASMRSSLLSEPSRLRNTFILYLAKTEGQTELLLCITSSTQRVHLVRFLFDFVFVAENCTWDLQIKYLLKNKRIQN